MPRQSPIHSGGSRWFQPVPEPGQKGVVPVVPTTWVGTGNHRTNPPELLSGTGTREPARGGQSCLA
jgi:hypothetical protein